MYLIDLHCDTLYKAVTDNIPLDSDAVEVKMESDKQNHKLQCYAIWLPDDYSGEQAEKIFLKSVQLLKKECNRCKISLIDSKDKINDVFNENKYSACFTVENALALNGKIEIL